MDVAISHKFKTALITYPKSGSCSLKVALNIETARSPVKHKWDWHTVEPGKNCLNTLNNILPRDYKIYAFCREPVERWISTFVFLLQTNYNLFYSDISTVGENIANANDQFYANFFKTIMKLNNQHATLSDMHMARYLYPLALVNTMYDNMKMVELSRFNEIVSQVNQMDYYDFPKENSAETGYSIGFEHSGSASVSAIKKNFSRILTPVLSPEWKWTNNKDLYVVAVNSVQKYLHLEKTVYKSLVCGDKDPTQMINEIFTEHQHIKFLENGLNDVYYQSSLNSYKNITQSYVDEGFTHNDVFDIMQTNVWRFRED